MKLIRLALKVTYRCPNQCIYCGRRKYMWKQRGGCDMNQSLLEKIFSPIIESRHFFDEIYFTGGEPSAYPLLQHILELASRTALPLAVTTSGWTPHKGSWLDILQDYPFRKLYVSIDDADSKKNDEIRGQGSFDRAMTTIKQAVALREDRGFPKVTVVTVVHRKNTRRLGELVRLLRESKVDRWLPSYLEAVYAYPDLAPTKIDLQTLIKQRKEDPELDLALGESFHPETIPWRLITHGRLPSGVKMPPCPNIGRLVVIHPNGRAYPCYGSEYVDISPITDFNSESLPNLIEALQHYSKTRSSNCLICPIPYQKSNALR